VIVAEATGITSALTRSISLAKHKRTYYWTRADLEQHRIAKVSNALGRRDSEYMKQRQKKLSRVMPKSFFAEARIEFISDKPNTSSDINIPIEQEEGLKNNVDDEDKDNP